MFLEQSEAICWNVFPLHEDTGTATPLAAPGWLGSRDRAHVTGVERWGGSGLAGRGTGRLVRINPTLVARATGLDRRRGGGH